LVQRASEQRRPGATEQRVGKGGRATCSQVENRCIQSGNGLQAPLDRPPAGDGGLDNGGQEDMALKIRTWSVLANVEEAKGKA
jgi:hypothetical protein